MKGFIIDPELNWVEEVDKDFEKLEELQAAVEGYIEVAGYVKDKSGGENVIYCDEEGMLKLQLAYTQLNFAPNPLAGRLLVIGTDDEGNSTDSTLSLEELRGMVKFLSLAEVKARYATNAS